MDAIANDDDPLERKVSGARTALARSVAKANLTGDPLGLALEAISDSLGAQWALHQASVGHLRDVSDRLDLAVAESVQRGTSTLDQQRNAIVQSLAPELAKAMERSVRTWNRLVTLKTALTFGGIAIALAFGVGLAGYGAGWQAGHDAGLSASGDLANAVERGGAGTEGALVNIVRWNNLRTPGPGARTPPFPTKPAAGSASCRCGRSR